MPYKPRKGQTRESYMGECIDLLMKEGKSYDKARDICYAVWIQNTKGKKKRTKARH